MSDELFFWLTPDLIETMRRHGVKRVRQCDFEVELADTIPAPPSFEPADLELPVAPKPPGICAFGDCGEKAGGIGAPELCRMHALQAAGVTR